MAKYEVNPAGVEKAKELIDARQYRVRSASVASKAWRR